MTKAQPPKLSHTEAFQLVGEFMFNWAFLENRLNYLVGALLGADGWEGSALAANMTVRDKINLARTLLDAHISDPDERKATMKILDRVSKRNGDRNMVAHTAFGAGPGGVTFFSVKAKGKFALPDEVWSVKEFKTRHQLMARLADELYALAAKHGRFPPAMNALAAMLAPNPKLRGQGLLSSLSRPPQSHPHSQAATPETGPRSDLDQKG